MDTEPQLQTPPSSETPIPEAEPATPTLVDETPTTPAAEPPSAATVEESPTALETLCKLAEASKAQRLSLVDEERATALLKELLGGGKTGIASAIDPLIAFPWIVSVNAVCALWPGFKPLARRQLLSGVAKHETEQARRLRLSLARAIFKIDPPAGLKLAASASTDLKEPETGALSSRNRQIFFNVFIGKGKPWLLQLALGDLKGAEADTLVHCAIETFPLCPPLSQLSILRWAHAGGRFKKLSASDLEITVKSIARWNGKLQRQLKADIEELPEAITAVFKPEVLASPATSAQAAGSSDEHSEAGAETAAPVEETASTPPGDEEQPQETSNASEAEPGFREPGVNAEKPAPEELVIPRRNGRPEKAEAGQPKARHKGEQAPRERGNEERRDDQREGRPGGNRDEKGRRGFDFKESMRGLESYVAGLRSELEQTKAQLRRREDEAHRGGRNLRGSEPKPAVDVDALLRHNAQLETTVQHLRLQLEDLAGHHEAVAESRLLHTDEPLAEGSAEQLTALLSIKLNESYSTYLAMRAEPLDRVFRLDYRDLLGSVFDVLRNEGVKLDAK